MDAHIQPTREAAAAATGPGSSDLAATALAGATAVHYALLAALLVAATIVRFAALADIPPGMYFDEGANGLDALAVLAGDRPIFFSGNQGREPLYIYAVALSYKLLGASPLSIRLVSAVIGLLTVLATYALGRALYGRKTALIATALIAFSFWHIGLSRLGFRAVALPLFEALAALCLATAFARRSARWWAAAGVMGGISLYTYLASRAVPFWLAVCAIVALVSVIRTPAEVRRTMLGMALAAAIGVAVAAPLGVYFYRHQDQFLGRVAAASARGEGLSASADLAASTLDTIGLLVWRGDPNPRHNLPGRPLFDPLVGIAFVAGLLITARRAREPGGYIPLIWTVVMLVPGALASEAPHFLRTSGILPAVFLYPAVGLSAAAQWVSVRRKSAAPMMVGVVIAASGLVAVYDYFGVWAGRADVYRAFWGDARDVVRYASSQPAGELVLVSGESYRLRANPDSLYAGASRIDREFDGLRGIIIPPDTSQDRVYLFPSSHTRDDGAHCPYVPCFTPEKVLAGPGGELALGVFRVAGAKSQPGTSARMLDARLGDHLIVRGYEVNPLVAPGQVTHLIVHSTISKPLRDGRDWKLFAHLVGPNGISVASAYGEQLMPVTWQPGDTYVAWLDLLTPVDARPGLYSIELGVFESGSQARIPVTDPNGKSIGDAIVIRPLRMPEPIAAAASTPAHTLDARLGDRITLAGYDIAFGADGAAAKVALHWRATSRPTDDYTVFVHVLSDGKLIAQQDSPPKSGALPTSVWQPGETVVDDHDVRLPPGLRGHPVDIVVGMYQLESGRRLAVDVAGAGSATDAITLTRVVVP